jgi:hypothetical protein
MSGTSVRPGFTDTRNTPDAVFSTLVKTGQKDDREILVWALSQKAGVTQGGEQCLILDDDDKANHVPDEDSPEIMAVKFKGSNNVVYLYYKADTLLVK